MLDRLHAHLPTRAARLLLVGAMTAALGLSTVPGGADASPPSSAPNPRAVTMSGDGQWTVTRTGGDTYQVSWRAPGRLPVTSDRPTIVSDGIAVGTPVLGADGRTVVTTVTSDARPDPAALDVVLSGDRLDEPGIDETGDVTSAVRSRATSTLASDPAAPGPYDTVESDYELEPVKLPGMPEPIEMVGHVEEPAADQVTGPRPLVLFLHGRHSYCYNPANGNDGWEWPCQAPFKEIPSQMGYDYMQKVLASQGFTTVSVRVNGINAQDFALPDGGADARAEIVQRHLNYWTTLADDRQVDLSRVVLVGHSRGGEGVNRASIQIPLDAPYRVVGQVLLAPTDFGTQTAPYVPTATVLPYCDGDVSDLQGQRFTDSARDLASDDTSLKSSVLVLGANHNFFNTEWTPGIAEAPAWDDWYGRGGVCGSSSPTRLSAAEQRDVGVAYVAGAAQLFASDAQEFLPMFDGSAVTPPTIGSADVRSAAIGGGRELRRPAIDSGLSLASGADASFCQGVLAPGSASACGRGDENLYGQVPHWYDAGDFAPPRRELELAWTEAGQSGGLTFDEPLDLSTGRLELRGIVDPLLGDVRIRLRLTDVNGDSAEVTPEGDGYVRALPVDRQVGKRWAQAIIADPAEAAGIDLAQVARIDVIGDSADGRLWILDVAAAPAALATVPEQRLPLVSLGSLTVTEGDDPAVQVARLPFTIAGEVTRPAELTVGVLDESRRSGGSRIRIDLAPGQTEGSIRYEYRGNTSDDYRLRSTGYFAYPVVGAMTDKYDGRVRLVDDDPAPSIRVRVPKRVSEGDRIEVRVRVRGETSYDSYLSAEVVRGAGPGRRLTVADVPTRWFEKTGAQSEAPTDPLFTTFLYLFDRLRPGQTTGEVSIPIRADRVREGKERITLRIRVNRTRITRTIQVVD